MIEVSGHRGYNAIEIENTRKAFNRAVLEEVDYIEFDVKSTRDRVPVVFHDENLYRLLGVRKRISQVMLKDLKKYHYKDGQEVMTLEELLNDFKFKIKFLLEIKSSGIEQEVLGLLKKHGVEGETIVQSFNKNIIKRCYKLNSGIRYGLCISLVGNMGLIGRLFGLHWLLGAIHYILMIKGAHVTYLNVDGPLVNDEFIKLCLLKGKKIILGARDTFRYLDKLDQWKIEIVNADNPGLMRKLLLKKINGSKEISL
ncbi:MAG: glycerophosphodiester phosphodiesterase [Promethearchaeota archaeon]